MKNLARLHFLKTAAVAAALALVAVPWSGGCESGSTSPESTGVGGEGGGNAPASTTDGVWQVPDDYNAHAGSPGGAGGSGASADMGAADPSGGGAWWGEESGGDGGDWGSEGGDEEPGGGGGNSQANVKAGVVDDNSNFEAFLAYSAKHTGIPNAKAIEVSERYILGVVAGEEPVANALVRISADGEVLWQGRTLASGEVLFHPLAESVSNDVQSFAWEVQTGAGTSNGDFARSEGQTIALPGPSGSPRPGAQGKIRADIALMVDTTGSMGDEIAVLRDSWLKITAEIESLNQNLDLRFALVIYRDRGDEYVVKYLNFTSDIQKFKKALEQVKADGGGDYPEDFDAALDVTVSHLAWDESAPIRIAFTLADAPPQLYAQEVHYPQSLRAAVQRGIRIHSIAASGSNESAEMVFRQAAQFTLGRFLFLTYANDIPGKPGSGTGSGGEDGYSVEQYLTGTLDELVVKLVNLDVLALTGEPLPGSETVGQLDPDGDDPFEQP